MVWVSSADVTQSGIGAKVLLEVMLQNWRQQKLHSFAIDHPDLGQPGMSRRSKVRAACDPTVHRSHNRVSHLLRERCPSNHCVFQTIKHFGVIQPQTQLDFHAPCIKTA